MSSKREAFEAWVLREMDPDEGKVWWHSGEFTRPPDQPCEPYAFQEGVRRDLEDDWATWGDAWKAATEAERERALQIMDSAIRVAKIPIDGRVNGDFAAAFKVIRDEIRSEEGGGDE